MKRSVCSLFLFVILFVLQTSQFHIINAQQHQQHQQQQQQQQQQHQALEYSVEEERFYLVNSLAKEHDVFPHSQEQLPGVQFKHNQPHHHPHHQHQYHQNHPNNDNSHPHKQFTNHPHHPQPQQYQQQIPQQPFPPSQHHQNQMQQQQQQPQPSQPSQPQHNENPLVRPQQTHTTGSMQQVLLHNSGDSQSYIYAHTQVEWKHESTHEAGQINEFFMNNFESSSYPMIEQHDHLAYYQYYRLQQYHQHRENLLFTRQTIDAHNDYDQLLNDHHQPKTESCDLQPSILMQQHISIFEESTCKASSLDHDHNHRATTGDSSANVPNLSQLTNKPSQNSNIETTFPLTQPQYHYESSLMGAIRHYWREVTGLCLASAIFLNWLFVVVKRRLVASGLTRAQIQTEPQHTTNATRSISKDTNSSSAQDSAFEELASPISLDDMDTSESLTCNTDTKSNISVKLTTTTRQRSSTLRAEPINIPTTATISPGHNNSVSTSLSNSLNTSEYSSRYSSDFDSIQRLGRGGFGIVFEAKNKIDDCHYAVKRICLPLEKEARERVMREVRALAKLDHAGIVRYYNAWLETPSDEWLKQHDAKLGIVHSKDGLSFPSTDGIYERNESGRVTKESDSKFGGSGDNSSSGLFGESPFKKRQNGLHKYLKNNSSSPSLDIVFEGSGSIRLESEDNIEKTDSSDTEPVCKDSNSNSKTNNSKKINKDSNNGDINSDSEDSDFIQFESKGNNNRIRIDEDDFSMSGHLTDPFSSSSSNGEGEDSEGDDFSSKQNLRKPVCSIESVRKKALAYQKELRNLNNVSLVENLHVEKVYLYIQMQLCRKDTLKDWLKTNCEHRDKTTIFDLFYQIVDAVEYVHSQDLIHRDLKPSNIFFSLDGTLKIGDFGLCRTKTSTGIGSSLDLQEYVAESDVERGFEAVHTEQVGTQLYMSPEQLNGLSYNQKVDVFAMGLILLELLIPFKTQMQRVNVLFKARNNLYSDEFRNEHPQEHELVKTLLSRSPLKRPTATEIKQHELLASAQLSQPVIERIYHRRRTISSNSSTE